MARGGVPSELVRLPQRHVIKRVCREGEERHRPARLKREIDHGAMHAVLPEVVIDMREVIEHQVAARAHFAGRSAGVAQRRVVGVIGIDIDPVEMAVGEARQNLVRPAAMALDPPVERQLPVEARKVDVDDVQLLRVAANENLPRELALVGPKLGDPSAGWQLGEKLIAGRNQPAVAPASDARAAAGRSNAACDRACADCGALAFVRTA